MVAIQLELYDTFSLHVYGDPKEKIISMVCEEAQTLDEILLLAGNSYLDLSYYYNLSWKYCFHQRSLPYAIRSNGEISWNVRYEDITVGEFQKTHNILDGKIQVITGIPQCGGPGIKDIADIWTSLYPILDQIATMFGVISGIVFAGKWIRGLFKPETPPPAIFDFILSRDRWNHSELAEIMELDKEDAKKLLKVFGFKWDKSSRQYIQGPNTKEIVKKLSEVSNIE